MFPNTTIWNNEHYSILLTDTASANLQYRCTRVMRSSVLFRILTIFLFLMIQAIPVSAQQIYQQEHYGNLTIPNDQLTIHSYQANDSLVAEAENAPGFHYETQRTYVVRSKEMQISKMDSSRYANLDKNNAVSQLHKNIKLLPEVYVQVGNSLEDKLIYQIAFEAERPMEYLFSSKQFEGGFKFFLFSESNADINTLTKPVLIELVSNDIKTINPVSKEIDHINIPLTEVRLVDDNVSDSAQVKIITKSNPAGYETFIPVTPIIELLSVREDFQGLGVQEVPISVRILGSSAVDSIRVNINVEKGTAQPNSFYVRPEFPAKFNLRSEGLGTVMLTASSHLNANELKLKYVFPWVFILMALLGGGLGGVVKFFTKRDKLSVVSSILKGVAFGLFGSIVYYVLGISLIQIEVSDIFNEFAILGFSALSAFLGVTSPKNQ